MASFFKKARKQSPSESKALLSNRAVLANLGKRNKQFIYIFSSFVSEIIGVEKRVVKDLKPLLEDNAVSFSTVQDVAEDFKFRELGPIEFCCQFNGVLEGLYAKSPYATDQNPHYFYVGHRSNTLELEISRLTLDALVHYGFAKSIQSFSGVQTLKDVTQENSVSASTFGLFNLDSGNVSSSMTDATAQDDPEIEMSPSGMLLNDSFRPSLSPITRKFLDKNEGLRDVLDGNLACIQNKKDAPQYVSKYAMSFALLHSSEYLMYKGSNLPVAQTVSMFASGKKKMKKKKKTKLNEDFQVLAVIIEFYKTDTLRKRCEDHAKLFGEKG